jgi:hypothetical protein
MSIKVEVKYSGTWYDVSYCIMKTSDIDMVLTNQDCTLREIQVSLTARSATFPATYFAVGNFVRITQDSKSIFHGYVKLVKTDYGKKEVNVDLNSAIMLLKNVRLEKLLLESTFDSVASTYNTMFNIYAWDFEGLLTYMLNTVCGYDGWSVNTKDGILRWYLPKNSCWNLGSSVTSSDASDRVYKELGTLWDLLQLWCIYFGYTGYFGNSNTDMKINFYKKTSVDTKITVPADSASYKKEKDVLKIQNKCRITYKMISDLEQYDDLYYSPYTESSAGGNQIITKNEDIWIKNGDGSPVQVPLNIVETELPSNSFMFFCMATDPTTALYGAYRHEYQLWYSLYDIAKYNITTDYMVIGANRNVTEHRAIFTDGIYLSEIEILDL